jgi:hypothetical protein
VKLLKDEKLRGLDDEKIRNLDDIQVPLYLENLKSASAVLRHGYLCRTWYYRREIAVNQETFERKGRRE